MIVTTNYRGVLSGACPYYKKSSFDDVLPKIGSAFCEQCKEFLIRDSMSTVICNQEILEKKRNKIKEIMK